MPELEQVKTDIKSFLIVMDNHLDYLASGIETKLNRPDKDGIIGVIELGADKDNLDDTSHQAFIDKHGRTLILIDLEAARAGRMHKLFSGDQNVEKKQTIALIDIKAVQQYDEGNIITQGMVYLSPHTAPYVVGRNVEWCRELFNMDEHTAGAVSSQHLNIRVDEQGVYLKDRDSTNGTLLSTGTYAHQAIERVNNNHEFAPYLEELLGKEAVEEVVEIPKDSSIFLESDGRQSAGPTSKSERITSPKLQERAKIDLKAGDILRAKEEIGKIIGTHDKAKTQLAIILESIGTTPDEIRTALDPATGDDDVRHKLLLQLQREIDVLGDANLLPERVQSNDPYNLKNVEQKTYGYPKAKYPPREYAAMLALAMLDGSFQYSNDTTYKDLPKNNSAQGEHRQAARMTLERHYRNDDMATSQQESENSSVKNFQYELKASLEVISQLMQEHIQALNHIQDILFQQDVDNDGLIMLSTKFVTETDMIVWKISLQAQDANALMTDERASLSEADKIQVQTYIDNLRMIQQQIENQRNQRLFIQMQLLQYRKDEMDIIALRGYVTNGSMEQLLQQEMKINANIIALI